MVVACWIFCTESFVRSVCCWTCASICSTCSLIPQSFSSVAEAFSLEECINVAFWSRFCTSAVVSVIFSPIIFIWSEVFLEFFACSLELSTTMLTACCTCDIVPLVLSAAVPRICDVESSCFAFSEISRITDFMASLNVMVPRDRSPISSFRFRSFSSTHTFKSPSASFPTTATLFLIFLLIEAAMRIAVTMHKSITTSNAIIILPRILLTIASFRALLVPTNTIPITWSVVTFWYTGIKYP